MTTSEDVDVLEQSDAADADESVKPSWSSVEDFAAALRNGPTGDVDQRAAVELLLANTAMLPMFQGRSSNTYDRDPKFTFTYVYGSAERPHSTALPRWGALREAFSDPDSGYSSEVMQLVLSAEEAFLYELMLMVAPGGILSVGFSHLSDTSKELVRQTLNELLDG